MALADSLRKAASKVTGKLGADVTIRYVTAGSYNTTTGAVAETESDTNIKGVVQNIAQSEVNELVQASDKRLIVAAKELATAPETKDRVVISSVVHQIVEVQTIDHDNTAITYELVLRA